VNINENMNKTTVNSSVFLLSLDVKQDISNKAVSMYRIARFKFPALVEATSSPSTPVLLWVNHSQLSGCQSLLYVR